MTKKINKRKTLKIVGVTALALGLGLTIKVVSDLNKSLKEWEVWLKGYTDYIPSYFK